MGYYECVSLKLCMAQSLIGKALLQNIPTVGA